MKKFHLMFLLLAFAGAACMVGFGISCSCRKFDWSHHKSCAARMHYGVWIYEKEKNERERYALTVPLFLFILL